MQRVLKFYRDGLGYETDYKDGDPPVCFFLIRRGPNLSSTLPFFGVSARDTSKNNPPRSSGFGGITLAYNVKNKEDAGSVMELVKKAGGTIVKEPQVAFWGGYYAYFADPDGYYWEVVWGPVSNLTRTGCANLTSCGVKALLF